MTLSPSSSHGTPVFHVTLGASFNFVPGGLLQSFPTEVTEYIVDPTSATTGIFPGATPTSVPDLVGAGGVVANGPLGIAVDLPDSTHHWIMDGILYVSSIDAADQATVEATLNVAPHSPGNHQLDFSTATFTLLKGANLSYSGAAQAVSSVAAKVYVAQLALTGHFS